MALNSSTADFMIQSALMQAHIYNRLVLDFSAYKNRLAKKVEEHLDNDVKWSKVAADEARG